jgi:hypothetical protein
VGARHLHLLRHARASSSEGDRDHDRPLAPRGRRASAAIADHLTIGSNVVITGHSGVATNVPSNRIMMGYPAVPIDQNMQMYKALRRLPRLLARLEAAEKRVSNPGASD